MSTGIVYGIKGYGQVDKKKISGNIYDPSFDAAVLVNTLRPSQARRQSRRGGAIMQYLESK
jgi:hypothetical protein